MADYLQRLVERANGSSDTQPRITPFIRQWMVEGAGGNEDTFESVSQVEAPDTATSVPAFNETQASARYPRVEGLVSKQNEPLPVSPVDESTAPAGSIQVSGQLHHEQAADELITSPNIRKPKDSSLQTEPLVHQRTEYEAVTVQPVKKTDQHNTLYPLSSMETGEENSASSSRQTAPDSNRLPSKQDLFPREELVSHSPTLSYTGQRIDAVGQSETRRSRALRDGVTITTKVPSSPPLKPSGTTVRSQDKNTTDLRPRNITASSSQLPSREQPRLVIGRLQVDIVPPQTKAPPPQHERVVPRVEHPQQKRSTRISSKLRFGLGQL